MFHHWHTVKENLADIENVWHRGGVVYLFPWDWLISRLQFCQPEYITLIMIVLLSIAETHFFRGENVLLLPDFLLQCEMNETFILSLFLETRKGNDRNPARKHTSESHARSLKELKLSQSHCSAFSCDWLTPHEPKPCSNYQPPLLTKVWVFVCVCVHEQCMCRHWPPKELDLPTVVMWDWHVTSLLPVRSTYCVVGELHPTQTFNAH